MKRHIIFVIGLLFMPFIWLGVNLAALTTMDNFYSPLELLNDYVEHWKSGESFGVYDE